MLSLIDAQHETVAIAPSTLEARRRLLTPEAIRFLVRLSLRFEPRRRRLLEARRRRRADIDAGRDPDFPPETADVRAAAWKVAPLRADLQDRRVEICGPASRPAILEGLNSGAQVFIADLDDSTAPTWRNILEGHDALCDAARGTLDGFCEIPATLLARPRAWHLVEKHFLVNGEPISASLFDFGLFFFHNARALVGNGSAPYFSLPKLEGRYEARLWNDVFAAAQEALGISRGTIRAAAAIDTVGAAFEMDEILWELREHSAGLSFGRLGYAASYAAMFRNRPECLLPDRSELNMNRRFLAACAEHLVTVCHNRGAHAIGCMSWEVPDLVDTLADPFSLIRVRDDKLREVWAGFDGTQVAHPWLVPHVKDVFDTYMPFPHQLERRKSCHVSVEDLLCPPSGERSDEGLAGAIRTAVHYLAAWLTGQGCVAIDGVMENAAGAELCRMLAWQRAAHFGEMLDSTVAELRGRLPERELVIAARLFKEMISGECIDSMTSRAYGYLLSGRAENSGQPRTPGSYCGYESRDRESIARSPRVPADSSRYAVAGFYPARSG